MSQTKKDPLKDYKPQFVVPGEKTEDGRLLARGKLKHGMKISGVVHKDFEMREFLTEDMFAAEAETPTHNGLRYNGELMCLQLLSVGTFKGPFTIGMIGRLKGGDYSTLRRAQMELELLGEAE